MKAQEFNRMVTPCSLYGALQAQQGHYMARQGLKLCPTKPEALMKYAHNCHKRFVAHLASCRTKRDHERLRRALMRRLSLRNSRDPEFFNAV